MNVHVVEFCNIWLTIPACLQKNIHGQILSILVFAPSLRGAKTGFVLLSVFINDVFSEYLLCGDIDIEFQ